MYLNHHHQANDADWMVYFHRMLGHLPMLVHPSPREVLVVGLGGGATAGATTRYEGAHVTVVELSRSVVRGAEWFRDVNYAVNERPNVTMLVDDGRNHLLVSGRTYDVVTADALFPAQAGSTNLYSVEYYQLVRRSLNPGGVMLQWVNGDIPEPEQKILIRSFLQVFPHVSLWLDGGLLVGSDQPLDRTLPWVDRVFEQPIARAALSQMNLRSGDDVRKLYLADRAAIEAYVGDGPLDHRRPAPPGVLPRPALGRRSAQEHQSRPDRPPVRLDDAVRVSEALRAAAGPRDRRRHDLRPRHAVRSEGARHPWNRRLG